MNSNHFFVSLHFVSLTFLAACNNEQNSTQNETCSNDTTNKGAMATNNLLDFGKRYAQAWCSQKPESVAAFFSENGSLTVNNLTPSLNNERYFQVCNFTTLTLIIT